MSLIIKNLDSQTNKETLSLAKSGDSVCTKLGGLTTSPLSSPSSLSSASIAITDKNNIHLVKKFAYVVCREYLSGAWKQIDYSDFVIERLS